MANFSTEFSFIFDPWLVIPTVLLAIVLSLITVVGNLMVMLSFYLDKNIRHPSNYYIFSLAISDFIIGLEGFPVYSYYVLRHQNWGLGRFLCDLWLSIDYSVCLASIYTVFCITIDRYCSVSYPALYRNWRTQEKCLLIIAIVWTVPTVLFSISIFGYTPFTGEHRRSGECYVQFMDNAYLNMGMYIAYYWSTLIVMLWLYWRIYCKAHELATRSQQKTQRLRKIITTKVECQSPSSKKCAKKFKEIRSKPMKRCPHKEDFHIIEDNQSTIDTSELQNSNSTVSESDMISEEKEINKQMQHLDRFRMAVQVMQLFVTKKLENREDRTIEKRLKKMPNTEHKSSVLSSKLKNAPIMTCQKCASVIEQESTAPCVSPEHSVVDSPVIEPEIGCQFESSLIHNLIFVDEIRFIDTDSILSDSLRCKSRADFPDDPMIFNIDASFQTARKFGGSYNTLPTANRRQMDSDNDSGLTTIITSCRDLEDLERTSTEKLSMPETQEWPIIIAKAPSKVHQADDGLTTITSTPLMQRKRLDTNLTTAKVKYGQGMSAEPFCMKLEKKEPTITVNDRKLTVQHDTAKLCKNNYHSVGILKHRFLAMLRKTGIKSGNYKSKTENRARKALRTITFILGAFVFFWTPFYVFATIYGFCSSCAKSQTFNLLFTISYYLCYMNSPLNPLCYAMANQQFKKALIRMTKGDFHRI